MTATWHHHVLSTNTCDISFRATVLCTSVVQVYMWDFKNLLAFNKLCRSSFLDIPHAQCHARGISGVWYGLRKSVGCGVAAITCGLFLKRQITQQYQQD
jgi:hypothetical protein